MENQSKETNAIEKEKINNKEVDKVKLIELIENTLSDKATELKPTEELNDDSNAKEKIEKEACCEIKQNGEILAKTDGTESVDIAQNIAVNGLSNEATTQNIESPINENKITSPNQETVENDLKINVDTNMEEIIVDIEKSILNAADGNVELVQNEHCVEDSADTSFVNDSIEPVSQLNSVSNTDKISPIKEINVDSETIKNNVEQKSEPIRDELLNSDDSIKSVIKNIIDALQTSPPVDIPSQVSEVNPAEGYISELEWRKRETALLVRIAKQEEDERFKQEAWQIKMKAKCDENEMLKAKLKTLEIELRAVCGKPGKNNDMVTKIKKQHEDLLTKARGMIFEKTKLVKNQELKIEALISQVASLKDMVAISKDMLNIRDMECKHLTDRMEAMDLRIQAEKERQILVQKKMESGNKLNEELKNEYLKQVELFKCLKQRYEEKVAILEKNQKEPAGSSSSSQNQ